jgi:hypothetical protein
LVITYTTDYRQDCEYNSTTEEYDQYGEMISYPSRFVFSFNGKSFTHTTTSLESTYYIDWSEFDDYKKTLTMTVT